MKVDVVVDLQYGSTAKGKVCQYLAVKRRYHASIRAQSINAGHTVIAKGTEFKMRSIPCAFVDPDTMLLIAPGAFLEWDLLMEEIRMLEDAGYEIRNRLIIDYRTWFIQPEDFVAEEGLPERMGSTGEASGSSLIRKLSRRSAATDAKAMRGKLSDIGIMVGNVIDIMWDYAGFVLVEGCQGTMLGVHTSPHYPYVTARECSVSGVLSECGISPRAVRDIYGVMRTYPIRVGGNSGPTGSGELTWEEVSSEAGKEIRPEVTTVTKRQRRIFEPSHRELQHAIRINEPTEYCLTFLDYVNAADEDKTAFDDLSEKSKAWIQKLDQLAGRQICWISTGRKAESYIER